MSARPTQGQLVLPLLESLQASGGRARTRDLCAAVAERARIPTEVRNERGAWGDSDTSIRLFDRRVRWAQQRAKLLGLARPVGAGEWELTGKGSKALTKARPGVLVTLFTTDAGVAVWGSCTDTLSYLDDGSVSLLFTSPPYPLVRQRPYGNEGQAEWLDWFVRLAEGWLPKLSATGSVVVNLGDVWVKGAARRSDYIYRLVPRLADDLGLHLVHDFTWQNPAKPANAEWVNRRRIHVRGVTETILWLSASDTPEADNRRVLVAYSDAMKQRIASGGEQGGARPSGWTHRPGAFAQDNGGAIATNHFKIANTKSSTPYLQGCKAAGLPVHPARMPAAIPDFFVRYLTRPDDLVFDPFGGSGKTAAAAEKNGRRWVISEIIREYLEGAALRFQNATGYRWCGA